MNEQTEVLTEQLTEPGAETTAATLEDLEDMEMAMFAADEVVGGYPAWRIADDECADWAISKIAEERAELDRIKDLADAQIERITAQVNAAQKRYDNATAYLTGKLAEYFHTVPHKKTKTTESYRLLSGTLKLKLGGVSMKQNDEKLVEYLKASGNADMIKTTEAPKWGEFKKRLVIAGGQIIDSATGEIVEGVEVIENPNTFSVDV